MNKKRIKSLCLLITMLLLCSLSAGNTVSAATKVGKVSGIVAVSKTKKQIQVKFKKIKNAKYRIAYSTNKKQIKKLKNGKVKKIKGVKYKKSNSSNYTLKKLSETKTYYISVCATKKVKKKNIYGKWSNVIAIKANGNAKAVSPKTTPKKIKVYAENNKIYAMDSWAEKYISIPNSMPVKTKIVVEGAKKVSFVTETGDILKVSSKGVVEPKVTKYYWSGNVGTTEYNPNADRVTTQFQYGKEKINVYADGKEYYVQVELSSYTQYYSDKVMDEYIKEKVNTQTSDYDKLVAICKFPTQYDYSPYASSASSMIIMKGGDCWASTGAIIALCNKVGIKAHSRNANRDAGAGSGHMNAVARIGNSYYICEAGYDEKAPRDYNIAKYDEPYIFSTWNDEATVYDYLEDEAENAVVPDTYKGVKVTKIGEMVFAGHDELKNIVLPETLTTIGDSAFYRCDNLANINIPKSVSSISPYAFVCVDKLENVKFDADNETYFFENGVVYDKDKTKVITSMVTNGNIVLPDTVNTIGEYAFYTNESVKKITIPESVKSIEEGAFGYCENMASVEGCDGIENISPYAFSDCYKLSSITLPESAVVEENAFQYSPTKIYRK